MKEFLICLSLLIVFNSAICHGGTQNNGDGIKPGTYEIIAKGNIWTDQLNFEDNYYVRNTGNKIQSELFGSDMNMKNKISCLIENFDFFIKCFRQEVPIEEPMTCAYHNKDFFKQENWYMSFSNCYNNSLNVQINEDSQTDEPFKIDIVSSGIKNKSRFWIATSKLFECPLMIGELDNLNLTENNAGDYYIFIPRDKIVFFYILSKSERLYIGTHEYVDLALPSGTLWATCNIGADSPGEFGDYFAWSETTAKKSFYATKTKYYSYSHVSYGEIYSKYWTSDKIGIADNKKRLELSDDAARQNWGGSWRIPTEEEWIELYKCCNWSSCSQNDHSGFKITSKNNGKSIFLPKAGWIEGNSHKSDGYAGWYWASTLLTPWEGSCLEMMFEKINPSYYHYRWHGISVRPVSSPIEY